MNINILGQKVKELVNEVKEAGYYEAVFDAGSLAPGIYIYRLKTGSYMSAKKMLLLKLGEARSKLKVKIKYYQRFHPLLYLDFHPVGSKSRQTPACGC